MTAPEEEVDFKETYIKPALATLEIPQLTDPQNVDRLVEVIDPLVKRMRRLIDNLKPPYPSWKIFKLDNLDVDKSYHSVRKELRQDFGLKTSHLTLVDIRLGLIYQAMHGPQPITEIIADYEKSTAPRSSAVLGYYIDSDGKKRRYTRIGFTA